jgi:signal peptidase I
MEENNSQIQKPEETESPEKSFMLYVHDLIHMLAVIMIVFMLLFRMVIVSGSSMYATLWDGDWLLLLSSVFYNDPQYGDIIVASKDSFNDGEAIIKRIIATEGQTVDIDFTTGTVYVDGVALVEPYIHTPTTNPEGMVFPLVVDEGCIFVMGDNRGRSMDSRDPEIGLIDKREVLGKAILIIWPGDDEGHLDRDFSRFGVIS